MDSLGIWDLGFWDLGFRVYGSWDGSLELRGG